MDQKDFRSIRQILLAGLCLLFLSVTVSAEEPPVLKTQKDEVNYAIGVNLVSNLKQQGVEIDLDLVIQGMKDTHSGGKLLMSAEDIRKAIYAYQTAVRQNHEKARIKATDKKKNKAGNIPAEK